MWRKPIYFWKYERKIVAYEIRYHVFNSFLTFGKKPVCMSGTSTLTKLNNNVSNDHIRFRYLEIPIRSSGVPKACIPRFTLSKLFMLREIIGVYLSFVIISFVSNFVNFFFTNLRIWNTQNKQALVTRIKLV